MRVHATLTIKVVYDDAQSVKQVKEWLEYVAQHLAGIGLLTDNSEMTVDDWDASIEANKEPR